MRSILIIVIFLIPVKLYAWGGRGHVTLCEASVHLIKNPELKKFLLPRGYILGHLCLIPDADWKGLSPSMLRTGNPGHYINPKKSGFEVSKIPFTFSENLKKVKGKNISEKHKHAGSNWWRANQFYLRSLKEGKAGNLPGMIHSLGLMGHFIGDNGNTFHVVDDYDGYESGHGGIHEYYETAVPGVWGAGFVDEIVKEADRIVSEKPEFLKSDDFLLSMRELAIVSAKEEKFFLESDPVTTPSSGKTPAIRKDPDLILEKWKPVILRSMARSALLQAKFMDDSYEKAGKPNLNDVRLYFPFRLPFIKPDYLK